MFQTLVDVTIFKLYIFFFESIYFICVGFSVILVCLFVFIPSLQRFCPCNLLLCLQQTTSQQITRLKQWVSVIVGEIRCTRCAGCRRSSRLRCRRWSIYTVTSSGGSSVWTHSWTAEKSSGELIFRISGLVKAVDGEVSRSTLHGHHVSAYSMHIMM